MVTRIVFDKLKNSGFIDLYLLFGFVLAVSFFILNYRDYSPIEILFGVIFITVVLKSLINIIVGYLVKYEDMKEIEESNKYQDELVNIESLLKDLSIQTLSKTVDDIDKIDESSDNKNKDAQKNNKD
jgi:hypothetical protein